MIPPTDRVFTPETLAARMVKDAEITPLDRVLVDYSCGDGALLRAAKDQAPWLALGGLDLAASGSRSFFDCVQGDFLDLGVRRKLMRRWGEPDVALLNPPFSRRGRRCVPLTLLSGAELEVPPALAFALGTCELLKAHGRLVCVLPGSLDRGGWWGTVEDVLTLANGSVVSQVVASDRFRGVRVEVTIYKVVKRLGGSNVQPEEATAHRRPKWTEVELPPGVSRIGSGSIRADLVKHNRFGASGSQKLVRYVHTTHLAGAAPLGVEMMLPSSTRSVDGTVVALPRVGSIRPESIRPISGPVVLSDCVHFVELDDPAAAARLSEWLQAEVHLLRRSARATGAAYRTRADLAEVLWKWWRTTGLD